MKTCIGGFVLKFLETVVDTELIKVSDWFHSNKLNIKHKEIKLCYLPSLPKKQKKINYQVQINLFDPNTASEVHLERHAGLRKIYEHTNRY